MDLTSQRDLLFGVYVGERLVMQTLFREAIWTLKTGEDLALAFAVRHHAKVPLLSWDVGGTPGAHFTFVTSTKVQILKPTKLRARGVHRQPV